MSDEYYTGSWWRRIFPDDPCPVCGYGWFSLDESHPFTRACILHDDEYGQAIKGLNELTIDEADFLLFWRWVLIAKAQISNEERCRLLWQICELWPLARIAGKVLWPGDPAQKLAKESTVFYSLPSSKLSCTVDLSSYLTELSCFRN